MATRKGSRSKVRGEVIGAIARAPNGLPPAKRSVYVSTYLLGDQREVWSVDSKGQLRARRYFPDGDEAALQAAADSLWAELDRVDPPIVQQPSHGLCLLS